MVLLCTQGQFNFSPTTVLLQLEILELPSCETQCKINLDVFCVQEFWEMETFSTQHDYPKSWEFVFNKYQGSNYHFCTACKLKEWNHVNYVNLVIFFCNLVPNNSLSSES